MTTQELLDRHEKAIKIIDMIMYFERSIIAHKAILKGCGGSFQSIVLKSERTIEVHNKCIMRLLERYRKLMNFEL